MRKESEKVYIHEAVKKALENDRCITAPEFAHFAKIRPTNTRENCIVMFDDGSHPSKYGWQPTAKDLIRNDWMMVD